MDAIKGKGKGSEKSKDDLVYFILCFLEIFGGCHN